MVGVPDTSPSALIVRLDGVGDAAVLVPLLEALRRCGVRTSILLSERNSDLFSSRSLERVHVANFSLRNDTLANRRAIAADAALLRQYNFDVALIATEDPSGYRVAYEAKIPQRIGFENGTQKLLKTLWVRRLCTQTIYRSARPHARGAHECETLFELGRGLLGNEAPVRDPALLRPYLLDSPPQRDSFVAMQITDRWQRVGVPPAAVSSLAMQLQQRYQLRFLAAAGERDYVEAFSKLCQSPVHTFGKMAPWKSTLAQAAVLVAPDCGAVHVAGMLGTPCVVVYPRQNFSIQSARWAPWAAPYRAVCMDDEAMLVAADAVDEFMSGNTPSIYRG